MALFIACQIIAAAGLRAEAFSNVSILDEQGRQLVPGGFVTLENVPYTPEDYQRMVRMGANFQVIRMPMKDIGGWPGHNAKPEALKQFDDMVRMGRDAGLRTIFKLVVYGVRPFGEEQWDAIWRNTDGTQDRIMAAWRNIWTRYKDEPSVFGYDLLNEPQRGLNEYYEQCQTNDLLPFLRRMTDAVHEISPEKWVLYQPLLRNPEDQWNHGKNPVVAINEPFGRERIIYAPHLYRMELPLIQAILDDLQRQAVISNAPLLLGEWGPLVVAGRLLDYRNDFKVPSFEMTVETDPKTGATEVFVPAERHFPNGFSVEIGKDLILSMEAGASEFRTIRAVTSEDEEQAKLIRWEPEEQRIVIGSWVGEARKLTITVSPQPPE